MRYSTEPRYRKYVKGYDFLSFTKKLDNKYGKKLMDTATKTVMGYAKTASKRVVQKTAEATSIGKPKKKKKKRKNKRNKRNRRNLYPTKKRQQIIDVLRLF